MKNDPPGSRQQDATGSSAHTTDDYAVRLTGVSRSFGDVSVLSDINLEIRTGELVVIVGPSGCGKTTLLNVLSGHDKSFEGAAQTRGTVRTVYQSDGLFPWLTAAQNIDLGLRDVKEPKERSRQRDEMLALIRLEEFANHYPHALSGGMRQRVEIARALAGSSDILLLDEPFSALDYQTRLRMRRELSRLIDVRPRTVVFVTHDIEEAAQLADRIVVLTERPATIQCEHRLETPRPRDPMHPEVVHAVSVILQELGLEDESRDADALNVKWNQPNDPLSRT
jgi:NitT/TauT family transport system ATP-binding protein